MLQYSIYSVISPEGCASILWKTSEKAEAAAEAMGVTADRLHKLGLVDEVVPEPLGGAHRDPQATAETLKNALISAIDEFRSMPVGELIARRRQRLAAVGAFREN
jgi:acetyl-CoA carboxylase carboxyl transferase subunit alpha